MEHGRVIEDGVVRVSGNRITAKLTKTDGDTGVKYTVFESTLRK